MAQQNNILMYKNKPLVRSGDTIYYGDMTDKYVVCMQVESSKKVGDLDVADKVNDKTKSKVCSRIMVAAERERPYCGYKWSVGASEL